MGSQGVIFWFNKFSYIIWIILAPSRSIMDDSSWKYSTFLNVVTVNMFVKTLLLIDGHNYLEMLGTRMKTDGVLEVLERKPHILRFICGFCPHRANRWKEQCGLFKYKQEKAFSIVVIISQKHIHRKRMVLVTWEQF